MITKGSAGSLLLVFMILCIGKASPLSNSWGHYLRVRHHSPNNLAWIVSGFVSVDTDTSSGVSQPHFAIFGRAGDEASIKGPWRR